MTCELWVSAHIVFFSDVPFSVSFSHVRKGEMIEHVIVHLIEYIHILLNEGVGEGIHQVLPTE